MEFMNWLIWAGIGVGIGWALRVAWRAAEFAREGREWLEQERAAERRERAAAGLPRLPERLRKKRG